MMNGRLWELINTLEMCVFGLVCWRCFVCFFSSQEKKIWKVSKALKGFGVGNLALTDLMRQDSEGSVLATISSEPHFTGEEAGHRQGSG